MGNTPDKKSKLLASIESLNRKKEESVQAVKPVIQESRVKRPVGRPSSKKDGVSYVKVGGLIPEETKLAMQQALLGRFRGVHSTQDEFIDAAIRFYLEQGK
jgi:hypothetical protein